MFGRFGINLLGHLKLARIKENKRKPKRKDFKENPHMHMK
jgi:hypothetical protein